MNGHAVARGAAADCTGARRLQRTDPTDSRMTGPSKNLSTCQMKGSKMQPAAPLRMAMAHAPVVGLTMSSLRTHRMVVECVSGRV